MSLLVETLRPSSTLRVELRPDSTRWFSVRIFLTCWLIYALHLSTNTVREIYPALSLGDHFSLDVSEYAGLHPDIFEKAGYGWRINSNPGASLVGAVPYLIARPIVDRIVAQVNHARAVSGATPPAYDSPWPMARAFFAESWRRGFDIKFGMASVLIGAFAMAPLSAWGAVLMFLLLRDKTKDSRTACWLALLYAFGTPVFFRNGYLNQNQLVAVCVIAGLYVLRSARGSLQWRMFLCGVSGGTAVLMDYSGVVILAALFLYAVTEARRSYIWFLPGCLGPLAVLWFCQWTSFGNPFLPAQHWMAPVQWIDQGYQGLSLPQAGMIAANAFDYRYGLFTSCPLLLASFCYPWVRRSGVLSTREYIFCLGTFGALLLFAGSVYFSKLQFNSGVRYLVPAVPLLFLPVAAVLQSIPRRLTLLIALAAIAQAWCMAMYRDVERGLGVLEPLLHVFVGGFQLPILTVLGRMGAQFHDLTSSGVSPLPLFVFAGGLLYLLWSPRPWSRIR